MSLQFPAAQISGPGREFPVIERAMYSSWRQFSRHLGKEND
jgi:hypothetical protein